MRGCWCARLRQPSMSWECRWVLFRCYGGIPGAKDGVVGRGELYLLVFAPAAQLVKAITRVGKGRLGHQGCGWVWTVAVCRSSSTNKHQRAALNRALASHRCKKDCVWAGDYNLSPARAPVYCTARHAAPAHPWGPYRHSSTPASAACHNAACSKHSVIAELLDTTFV
jgi:hypothetical protein